MRGQPLSRMLLLHWLLWKMEIEALPYSYTFGWVLMLAYELPAMLRYLRKNKM